MPAGTHRGSTERLPAGVKLRASLSGHTDAILRIAWSRDGRWLATPSVDKTIRIWDTRTGECRHVLTGHTFGVNHVAWSPDGGTLVSVSFDRTIRVWNAETGTEIERLAGRHDDDITTVAWSPDNLLVTGSADGRARWWNTRSWQPWQEFHGAGQVRRVCWSNDGGGFAIAWEGTVHVGETLEPERPGFRPAGDPGGNTTVTFSPTADLLATAGFSGAVQIWDLDTRREVAQCEGHTGAVTDVAFSPDGRILASKSKDGSVRLWRTGTWETLCVIKGRASTYWPPGLAFHPVQPLLAAPVERDTVIHIWEVDVDTLVAETAGLRRTYYANAKVVLLGDSGVGKSGLGLVLSGQAWAPTESTHGRRVFVFDSAEEHTPTGDTLVRETLLWDLAGQAGYRLVHQLHLGEVSVALVVFDSRSELDPFAGVRYWDRAIRQARRTSASTGGSLTKLLVAARADRGTPGVSQARLDAHLRELGFDGYFETSAKEDLNVAQLATAIRDAIRWDLLPRVSSNDLFSKIKAFLISQKESGRLLLTSDELFARFIDSPDAPSDSAELRADFEICIRLVESRDLIRQLSFGGLVLLQPELLDAYASSMVSAALKEPDGLGSILEEIVLQGRFGMPADERIKDRDQERLLLLATVENLLDHELALRTPSDEGNYLVFPSQLTRERADLTDNEATTASIQFDGPTLNIYTTLVVRLSHSGVFESHELWRNAAEYRAIAGGTCGLLLRLLGEGRGELALYFDEAASGETRATFERYVRTHVERRALPQSIIIRRTLVCSHCGSRVPSDLVERRRQRGLDWLNCSVCDQRVDLGEPDGAGVAEPSSVATIDKNADARRDEATATTVLAGKKATSDFDVFLCHNSADNARVRQIAHQLRERGINPWLDEEQLQPGLSWQEGLERNIRKVRSAAVFVSGNGIGPWHRKEQEAFLLEFANRHRPVIPVILPGTTRVPKLPIFLRQLTWVDFRQDQPDPLDHLSWGITGDRQRRPIARAP